MNTKKCNLDNPGEPKARGRRPVEDEGRPLYGGIDGYYTYDELVSLFSKRPAWFITLNPYKKGPRFNKLQTIGPINDILKKYCSSFFLVKEQNPDLTSHYHAICHDFNSDRKHPKGLTFYPLKVGGATQRHIPDDSLLAPVTSWQRERGLSHQIADELGLHHHLLRATQLLLTYIYNAQRKCLNRETIQRKRKQRHTHVGRVIEYMLKEQPEAPVPYDHFILKASRNGNRKH